MNKKRKEMVVFALLRARDIIDSNVTLSGPQGGLAYVTCNNQRHVRYKVHNLDFEWATYNYVHVQRGNICKHQVKVL